jgi:hypothetical protein
MLVVQLEMVLLVEPWVALVRVVVLVQWALMLELARVVY